jgi:CRP-like cAMP-binding protein
MDTGKTLPLPTHIARFVRLSAEEEQQVIALASRKEVPRRSELFRAGDAPAWVYVERGLLRLCKNEDDGSERTLQFGLEGWWIGDLEALGRGRVSEFSIHSVEDSTIVWLDAERYERLFERVPAMERYFRRVYQRGFAAGLRRVQLIDSISAADRYRNFVRDYPDFVERVPGYMLASFLGFSPEFLSKIRAQKPTLLR